MKITDKMRLDWLMKNEVSVMNYEGEYWIHDGTGSFPKTVRDSGRSSIDAAILAERKPRQARRKP